MNIPNDKEYRYIDSELRADDTDAPIIEGYAAVFDQWADIYGGMWKEKIQSGAFAKTIQEADIRALFNHDPNIVLGRNRAKTLRLSEDDFGLKSEIDINKDDPDGMKVFSKIKRGDVTQMSFAFRVIKEQWDDEYKERILQEVKLYDVSPVTYPAYPQTSIKARSLLMENGINVDALSGIVFRAGKGAHLELNEIEVVSAAIDALKRYVPPEPGIDTHSETQPGIDTHCSPRDIIVMRKRLVLIEMSL